MKKMKHWEFTSRAYLGTLPRLIDDIGVVKSEIGHFSVGSQHQDVQGRPRFRSRFVIKYAYSYSTPPKWISKVALASAAAQEPNCAEVGTGLYEYPDNCRKY